VVDWFAKEGFGERCESFSLSPQVFWSPLFLILLPASLSIAPFLPTSRFYSTHSLSLQGSERIQSKIKLLPPLLRFLLHRLFTTLSAYDATLNYLRPNPIRTLHYLQSRAYVYSRAILAFSYCFFFSSGLPFDLNVTAFKEDGDSRYRKERINRLFGRFFDSC